MNLVFSPPVPDRVPATGIAVGRDVCMTICRVTKQHTWSPNKMSDALAAGPPVLINVPGRLGDMVESNKCGRYVVPGRPEGLADPLQELCTESQLCQELGGNARALAQRQFARDTLTDRLEGVLRACPSSHSRG